jgi:uncharacterized coiled-coil protein SlyX
VAIPLGLIVGALGLSWNVLTRQVDAVDQRIDTLDVTTKDRDAVLDKALGICVGRVETQIAKQGDAQVATVRALERIETKLAALDEKVTKLEPNSARMTRLETLMEHALEGRPD